MHIPTYHKRKGWQRFFLGVVAGSIVAYFIIMYMYGSMYEQLFEKNLTLASQVAELEDLYESLLQDQKDEDEENKKQSTVETIEIVISNAEELKFDRLIIHQFSEMIKQEIKHIVGQDISIISESDQLLISTIENKSFTVDDFTYYFEIEKLIISQTIKLHLIAKISN